MKDKFYNRATSALPISVGTSLALESIFSGEKESIDPSRKPPIRIPLKKYPYMYFNVSTLLRNIINSSNLKADEMPKIDEQVLYDIVYAEIDVIKSVFRHEGGGLSLPVFYLAQYKNKYFDLLKKHDCLRQHKGGLGIAASKIDSVIEKLIRHNTGEFVITNDTAADLNNSSSSIIFTHVTYDLLSHKGFSNGLSLLESHTGQLKDKSHWNTKYYKLKDDLQSQILRMPFNRYLLAILGDTYQIKPYDIKKRKEIAGLSKTFHWTPITTEEKVYINLKQNNNDANLKAFVNEIQLTNF